jgi:hypothetical protein
MSNKKTIVGAVCVAALLAVGLSSREAVSATQPPNCAAIAFRPILSRSGDGQQDAGLYKSRFGRIELKAQVKDGVTTKYFVEINGKALNAIAGELPDSIAACAKAKRLSAPTNPDASCTGDQLTVMVDHTSDQRYVLLYVHRAGAWHFCSAGIA